MKKLSKNTKLFLSFSIISILFVSILFIPIIPLSLDPGDGGGYVPPPPPPDPTHPLDIIPPPDPTITTTGYAIEYNWLTVEPEIDPNSKISYVVGGLDLLKFENLGSSILEDNTIKYKAKTTFSFDLVLFPKLGLTDVFPNMVLEKWSNKIDYAGVVYSLLPITPIVGIITANMQYNYVSLGALKSWRYSNLMPVTVGINPTFSSLVGIDVSGITIENDEYLYEVKAINVVDRWYGTTGNYYDYYTEQQPDSKGVIGKSLDNKITPSEQQIIDKLEAMDLGFKTDLTPDYVTNGTILQQLEAYVPGSGASHTNTGTGDFTFLNDVLLQSEVTKTTQRIDFRCGSLAFQVFPPFILYVVPITTPSVERVISAHLTLPFIHQVFEVEVYFEANIELNAILYESALEDPYYMKGDWMWNPTIREQGLEIPTDPLPFPEIPWEDILFWIITILIIIVCAWVFVKIGIPLILLRKKKSN